MFKDSSQKVRNKSEVISYSKQRDFSTAWGRREGGIYAYMDNSMGESAIFFGGGGGGGGGIAQGKPKCYLLH